MRANPLDEYLVCDGYVYTLGGEPVRMLDLGEKRGADVVAELVAEIVPNGSCLVFCPTKVTTESTAAALAQMLTQRPGYAPCEKVMARISNEAHVVCSAAKGVLIMYIQRSLAQPELKENIFCMCCLP